MQSTRSILSGSLLALILPVSAGATSLPDDYFRMLARGIAPVESRFAQSAPASLQDLEQEPHWQHFPSALLVAAVLYAKADASNPRYGDPRLLALALRMGDLLVKANEDGTFTSRPDHHRDTYMWLDAYRILFKKIDPPHRERWARELRKNLADLAQITAERADRGAYTAPFLGTSPNHFSLWASTLYLGGRVFGEREWESLGARVLHRFSVEEQAPDGYWGEHDQTGPTPGYDYLTLAAVALYWEHSHDPAAISAMRRNAEFHEYFTYPDGTPVEVIDDRNRYWSVSPWGQFGFSNFPDGRRYAEFLTGFYSEKDVSMEALGRIAQDTLYYRKGPIARIPQDETHYVHRMLVPASIRKSGPWVVCLSGLTATQPVTAQFFLDRQGTLSIFHEKLGLIVTGANSRHQPELATFWERIGDSVFHTPLAGRVQTGDQQDRLALAYNNFLADVYVSAPTNGEVVFRFAITRKREPAEAQLNLQMRLNPGEGVRTGGGLRFVPGREKIDLGPEQIGGWIRHHGWIMKVPPEARLKWPVYPYNPYSHAAESAIEHAVAVITAPIARHAADELSFTLEVIDP